MKYVLSYGGGVNSSALFFHLVENNEPLDLVIFSDNGEELEQTYEAVDRMEEECRKRGIAFARVKSHLGNLYDYHYGRKIVPSIMRRDCTGKFKVAPIRRYLRDRYGKQETFTMYIGIAMDEAHRASTSDVKYIQHAFPFIKAGMGREENVKTINRHGFRAEKSGCTGCPYISKKGYIKLLREQPEEFERWKKLELNCSAYPRIRLLGKGPSLKDIEEAERTQTTIDQYDDASDCGDCAGGCFL